MKDRTAMLMPGGADRVVQRGVAEGLLWNAAALPHERAHAKCWMTYRAIEGEIPFEVWEREVQPVVIEQIEDARQWVRWVTSLRTAEFYLRCLRSEPDTLLRSREANREQRTGDTLKREQRTMMPWGEEDAIEEWLWVHPSFVINFLRVECVMAYRALLLGFDEECKQRVIYGMQTGLRQAARQAFDVNPLRIFEMRDDWHAYVTLLLIGQKLGCVAECHAPWANAAMIERDDGHLPYVKCLQLLGTGGREERRIWKP